MDFHQAGGMGGTEGALGNGGGCEKGEPHSCSAVCESDSPAQSCVPGELAAPTRSSFL